MAQGKKSFVLYSDQRSIIDMLPNDKAGMLLKHIFAYVNDENPINEDPLIMLAFEPIKLQMKRDLVKWETTKEGRSAAGKASAEARRLAKEVQQSSTNSTNVNFVQQSSTNSTVNDNVTVNVNVNDNVILLEKETKDNIVKFDFKKTLLNLGFNEKLVSEWIQIRKVKKAVNSETALKAFLREIKESKIDKNEILQLCVERSWSGFKNEYLTNLNFTKNGNTNSTPINRDQQIAEYTAHVLAGNKQPADSEGPNSNSENGNNDFTNFEIV